MHKIIDHVCPNSQTGIRPWPERFPLGKMSLISGKPDNGKSQVTLDIVARTTRGSEWPEGSKNILGPSDVLMAVAEDDLADTVIPRLKSAGADLTRIKFISRVRTQEFDEQGRQENRSPETSAC
jgi:hypothetical protein